MHRSRSRRWSSQPQHLNFGTLFDRNSQITFDEKSISALVARCVAGEDPHSLDLLTQYLSYFETFAVPSLSACTTRRQLTASSAVDSSLSPRTTDPLFSTGGRLQVGTPSSASWSGWQRPLSPSVEVAKGMPLTVPTCRSPSAVARPALISTGGRRGRVSRTRATVSDGAEGETPCRLPR